MKKLITSTFTLAFALLFSAGIAFGQNNATTSQTGSGNKAKIAQHNSGNTATITQDGTNNSVVKKMDQTYVATNAASGVNVVTISQVGNKNTVKNNSNYGGAVQAGASNSFQVDQNGGGNLVENIHQGTPDNKYYSKRLSSNGVINIIQGKDAPGTFAHYAYNKVYHADQYGNGNILNVTQRDENGAYIQAQVSTGQVGNTINITQTAAESMVGHADNGHGSGGYGAFQHGTNNSMDITQGMHDAAGTQTVGSVFAGADNGGHAGQSLVQLGSDNSLTINQKDGSPYRVGGKNPGVGNVVKAVLQNGSGNSATITQSMGSHSTAGVSQVGTGNISTINQ
jgi:hypothetical protein